MRLSYRGVSYDCEPSAVDMIEGGVAGKYRGQAWKTRYPRHVPAVQPTVELQYRGVVYQKQPGSMATKTMAPVEGAIAALVRTHAHKQTLTAWAETHRDNLCRNVQHRLDIARQRGDQALVQLLEQELQQIVCSAR